MSSRRRFAVARIGAWVLIAGVALTRDPALSGNDASSVAAETKALLDKGSAQAAVELAGGFLKRAVGGAELYGLFGQALLKLGRKDEAAHAFEQALSKLGADSRDVAALERKVGEADPLGLKRRGLFKRATRTLLESAQKLADNDNGERALELAEALVPISTSPERETLGALIARIRAAATEVSLDDASTAEKPSGAWPTYEHKSAHYELICNLEPQVVDRLGAVMDDIWNYYVTVYFDGDASKATGRPAKIRVYTTQKQMLEHWSGDGAPLGWWSPSDWQVTTYDTTSDSGSLDPMLVTLFHEASHQFMTMLEGGGSTPAWINEGTASFFEGAVAMADGRVLWPDAAQGRMAELEFVRKQGKPTVADVLAYSKPESYPGEYYSVGWSLVYYLLQYEDPDTLEYSRRPLYARYRTEIIKKGTDPLKLFEELFIGKDSPGGFASVDEFTKAWGTWLDEQVYPLHRGDGRKAKRLAAAKRYLAAAEKAKGKKKAKVSESELLLRALGHVEYVRTKVDTEPDPTVLELQATLLSRLGRQASAAPVIETLLNLVDAGKATLDPKRYEELEAELSSFDKKNAALRNARGRAQSFAVEARKLLAEYEAKPTYPLRSYTFARAAAAAFDDPADLGAAATRLRGVASTAGVLSGSVCVLGGPVNTWSTIHSQTGVKLSIDDGRVSLETVRPYGAISTATPVQGEYEVRARLRRDGEKFRSSMWGVVFSGTVANDWLVFGINGSGTGFVKWLATSNGGNPVERPLRLPGKFEPPIGEDENPEIAVRVFPDGHAEIRVGARSPQSIELPRALPASGYVGIYAKDAKLTLEDFVVELFP
ncbi:MAG: DUF1570 domain-containing protein [Planctomycetes bacterium]|nr:DUF1570 domain-containing protein [Planctomycetota bacterium]